MPCTSIKMEKIPIAGEDREQQDFSFILAEIAK